MPGKLLDKNYWRVSMKKIKGFILLILVASILSGCAYTDWPIQIKTTSFEASKIEQNDNVIMSKGKVKVHDSYGVLLAVEVSDNTPGTMKIVYSKDKNELEIFQDWRKILQLEEGNVSEKDSGEITVELSKGLNEFIISGTDCSCEYVISLSIPAIDKIVS